MKPPRPFVPGSIQLVPRGPRPRPAWRRPARPAAGAAPALSPAEAERRSRLMTMVELAVYVRYLTVEELASPRRVKQGANAAYLFASRHGIKMMKRGVSQLVRVGDVDRYLETGESDRDVRATAIGRRR